MRCETVGRAQIPSNRAVPSSQKAATAIERGERKSWSLKEDELIDRLRTGKRKWEEIAATVESVTGSKRTPHACRNRLKRLTDIQVSGSIESGPM